MEKMQVDVAKAMDLNGKLLATVAELLPIISDRLESLSQQEFATWLRATELVGGLLGFGEQL